MNTTSEKVAEDIRRALRDVQSGTIKGLNELKDIFTRKGRSAEKLNVDDDLIHMIFEVLFEDATKTKSVYTKSKTSRTEASAESRLTICAAVLRYAAETWVGRIRSQTVRALVDHITQLLPTPASGFCRPLRLDYLRTLVKVFEYQSHVEHLPSKRWDAVVEFCLSGIQAFGENLGYLTDDPNEDGTAGSIRNKVLISTPSGRRQNGHNADESACLEELFRSLALLTLAPMAPILEKSKEILSTVGIFLQAIRTNTYSSSFHMPAMTLLNNLLIRVSTQSTKLTYSVLDEVFPTFRSMWTSKEILLRDEILISLYHFQEYLLNLAGTEKGESLIVDIERLLEVMTTDYYDALRGTRGHLELDELLLGCSRLSCELMPFQNHSFALRKANSKCEHNWAVCYFIAFFVSWIDLHNESKRTHASRSGSPELHKRRRKERKIEELLATARNSNPAERTYVLQVVSFVTARRALDVDEIIAITNEIMPYIVDSNAAVSSWAMLGLIGCANQHKAKDATLSECWATSWKTATAMLTSPSLANVVSQLLVTLMRRECVPYADMIDSIESITSAPSIHGPSILSDSTLEFWNSAMTLRMKFRPSTARDKTGEEVLRWLFMKWNPSGFENRQHARQISRGFAPIELAKVFYSTSNLFPFKTEAEIAFPRLDKIGHSALNNHQSRDLVRYLLLSDERDELKTFTVEGLQNSEEQYHWIKHSKTHGLILDFLAVESSSVFDAWQELYRSNHHLITEDMVQLVFSLCLIGASAIASITISGLHLQKAETLGKRIAKLSQLVLRVVSQPEDAAGGNNLMHAALETISPFLLPVIGEEQSALHTHHAQLLPIIRTFIEAMTARREGLEASQKQASLEFDDFEQKDPTPASISLLDDNTNMHRADIPAQSSTASFVCCTAASMHFLEAVSQDNRDSTEIQAVPHDFIEYVLELPATEVMACRVYLRRVLTSELQVRPADAEALLVHLATTFLANSYEYERCEVSIGLCLDIMIALAPLWTDPELESLCEAAEDVYRWLITQALARRIASAKTQNKITDLLYSMLQLAPDFASSSAMPSVRTTLFSILKEGEVSVQYQIALRIPEVFELFVLAQHHNVFEDIHSSLPNVEECMEGIFIRLLVLSRLAASWQTLLRRSLYHMVETAGQLESAVPHARMCIRQLTSSVHLQDPKELIRLFSSQLLYTWMLHHKLNAFPFRVFGHETLMELLVGVQGEIVSQLIMSGSEDELRLLEEGVSKSAVKLIEVDFSQVAAYCFATDMCSASNEGSPSHDAETRLRTIMSKNHMATLLTRRLGNVIGHLFLKLEGESHFEKSLSKRKGCDKTVEILRNIKSGGFSDVPLPPAQQPSFPAKKLIDEIERLCRRCGKDVLAIWTPDVVYTVARLLIDNIHPVLGSLHTKRIVQRIRILLAFAGSAALEGYPLEMIVHALRPLATDPQCAEDSQGCLRYLLGQGLTYLRSVPTFVGGTLLALFMSLRGFLKSGQDRTTQESQHRTTMSRTQAFHHWLKVYVNNYNIDTMSNPSMELFLTLLRSAAEINSTEPGGLATAENNLLHCLLEAQETKDIFRGPLYTWSFDTFSQQFRSQQTSSATEEVYMTDEAAATYAARVWKTLKTSSTIGEDYLLWAVRMLGRSFTFQGELPAEIADESDYKQLVVVVSPSNMLSPPKMAILKVLVDHLQNQGLVVATIERCLQQVVNHYAKHEGRSLIEGVLPESLLLILEQVVDERPDVSATPSRRSITEYFNETSSMPFTKWMQDLVITLCQMCDREPILLALPHVLHVFDDLAGLIFPYILHILLLRSREDGSNTGKILSESFAKSLRDTDDLAVVRNRAIINVILYLRAQALPQESTTMDRNDWLTVDYMVASQAAIRCKMFKSAQLFAELYWEQNTAVTSDTTMQDLLLNIYRQIEEPDSYYGVKTPPTLNAIVNRLDFEGNGVEGLLLRGANSDGLLRSRVAHESQVLSSIVHAVASLNLSTLTHNLIIHNQHPEAGDTNTDELLQAAMKLRKWDVPVEGTFRTHTAAVYEALQSVNQSGASPDTIRTVGASMLHIFHNIQTSRLSGQLLRNSFAALATLTEVEDVVRCENTEQVLQVWEKMKRRESWMENSGLANVSQFLSTREVLFGILNDSSELRDSLKLDKQNARLLEAESSLRSSRIYRKHNALQASLSNVTYLTSLVPSCKGVGLNLEGAIEQETASVLWDKGEILPAIQISKNMLITINFEKQSVKVGKGGVLADLGRRASAARLEQPEEIVAKYLIPALKELGPETQASEMGKVHHEYATHCYDQLQNPDHLKELQRSVKFRQRKFEDIRNLDQVLRTSKVEEVKRIARTDRHKAKVWLNIDEEEHDRLKTARADYVKQSLDNFLCSLSYSDSYATDVLKFVATWLQHTHDIAANQAVERRISAVPTSKFAKLMNQLASRLQNSDERFQLILRSLVERICIQHPYHGMPNIFAGSKTAGGSDQIAISRNAAALKVVQKLQKNSIISKIWAAVHKSNELYIDFAVFKLDDMKQGSTWPLAKYGQSRRVARDIPRMHVPPITLSIDLRGDCDYSAVPTITHFGSQMSIAGGLSAPKIVTVTTSAGQTCKQLYKFGADDLRQDAIMEQVFAQVTELLKISKATRQRDLRIRTYNVVPLNGSTGAIEFCQPSIPLADYLEEAHERYYPKDLKWRHARRTIADVVAHSQDMRIKVFQDVVNKFHPVMRHFFYERFLDPDEWFERRLAYTRSTAAISILGHVLGLGDRHCQNILIDTNTGEVIHIDLGVAFEAGRALNVPETVPFRLTRDIVDGFGIAGTEGVFRRCCEFTLEALRIHKDAIMTLLNVLRYDPLYNWTISPLRAKRMQDEQGREIAGTGTSSIVPSMAGKSVRGTRSSIGGVDLLVIEPVKNEEDEADEAVRALRGVEKKLATGLSVTAAVNELIQQASDVKQLALLFAGWSAFA